MENLFDVMRKLISHSTLGEAEKALAHGILDSEDPNAAAEAERARTTLSDEERETLQRLQEKQQLASQGAQDADRASAVSPPPVAAPGAGFRQAPAADVTAAVESVPAPPEVPGRSHGAAPAAPAQGDAAPAGPATAGVPSFLQPPAGQ